MQNERGFSLLFIILGIFIVIGIVLGSYFFGKSQSATPQTQSSAKPSPILQPASIQSPAIEITNWKIYKNVKYGYLLKYPNNLPPYNGLATSDEEAAVKNTTDVVIFGCGGFEAGVCLPNFSIRKTSLSEAQMTSIFNLKINDQVDKEITYKLGGEWNQKTNYTRLTDQGVNKVNLLVLDNPSGYGGANRSWFVKRDGMVVLQFDCVYPDQTVLATCQNIMSTLEFTQ